MTCEQLHELLPDFLYDELDAETRASVETHLASCPKCAEKVSALRSAQGALDQWTVASKPVTKTEMTAAITGSGSVTMRYPTRHLILSLATGALAAAVVFAALSFYKQRGGPPFEQLAMNPAPQTGGKAMKDQFKNEFLLLLMENPSMFADMPDVNESDLVAEYQAWAGGIAQQQRTVVGKKLTNDRHFLGNGESADGNVDAVAGYFRIGADTIEEALGIAQTCPHLKYGGRIEVRQVDGRTED